MSERSIILKKNLKEIGDFFGIHIDSFQSPVSAAFDSRKIERKGLFFALKGEKYDGHDFLKEVAAKGALAAVVSNKYRGSHHDLVLLPVEDVQKALQQLAQWIYQENPSYVLAITGTVGKTTTKEFIADLLAARYQITKPLGSENSQVSLPLILLNQRQKTDLLVLEMGMSFSGEITKLVEIAPPDFGVLTKVSLVHSKNFSDIDAIAKAKMEMFAKIQMGLFNLDTMEYPSVRESSLCKTFYSMTDSHADYFLKKKGNQVIVVEKGEESPPISISFQAFHLLENLLCAVAVARMHKVDWETIIDVAAKMKPYQHRFQIFERNGITYVDDSYNANVASVKAALNNLPKGKKTIALLGSMKELGKFSERCHEEVGEVALSIVDHLLCIGKETEPMFRIFQKAGKIVEKVSSIEDAKKRLVSIAKKGDVVLIKGSNSFQLWNVLNLK